MSVRNNMLLNINFFNYYNYIINNIGMTLALVLFEGYAFTTTRGNTGVGGPETPNQPVLLNKNYPHNNITVKAWKNLGMQG